MNSYIIKHYRGKLRRAAESINKSGSIVRFWDRYKPFKALLPAELLESAEKITVDWPASPKKPLVGLVQETFEKYAYWPAYQRFLVNNAIPFEYYDIHRSDFVECAKKYDLILWHTLSSPSGQAEAKSKIEFLEKDLGKQCYPSAAELWFYEDKARQHWLFEKNQLPIVKTLVSYSKAEALQFIESCSYPIVSKELTNSSSHGVRLIRNPKAAKSFCDEVFGPGLKTTFSYLRQKDYVYFQEFVPNYGYDLRVIMAADSYFGYYRYTPAGDFRASGSDDIRKAAIPEEALLLAKKTRESLHCSRFLAVDMLKDRRDDLFYIIEASTFVQVRTSEQLRIDGVAGRYQFENETFNFSPGRFWVQELVLQDLMKQWIEEHH
jgi:glutathione synthase/RimK-type ligase-like ATP-grasp enzyme